MKCFEKVTYIIPYGGFMVMNAMVQSEKITCVLLDQHVFPNSNAILQSMPIEGAMQESSFSDSQFTKQSQPQEFQDLTKEQVKIHRIQ